MGERVKEKKRYGARGWEGRGAAWFALVASLPPTGGVCVGGGID